MTIIYTDDSWNPIVGCSPVSAGCGRCWAARDAATRLAEVPAYKGLASRKNRLIDILDEPGAIDRPGYAFNGKIRFRGDIVDVPLRKQKRQRYFVCSTSDIFHEKVEMGWLDRMFAVMMLSPWHTYLLLTKRPENARRYLTDNATQSRTLDQADRLRDERPGLLRVGVGTLRNCPWIWWGTSIESESFKWRLELLNSLPVARRWLSLAPLLGPVKLEQRLDMIHWVVVEGESGPHARPCDTGWIRQAVADCREQYIPVYVKQIGHDSHELGRRAPVGPRYNRGSDPKCWPTDLRDARQFPTWWQPHQEEQLFFSTIAQKRKAR